MNFPHAQAAIAILSCHSSANFAIFTPSGPKKPIKDCLFVLLQSICRMINMPLYYYYPNNNESQWGGNEKEFITFASATSLILQFCQHYFPGKFNCLYFSFSFVCSDYSDNMCSGWGPICFSLADLETEYERVLSGLEWWFYKNSNEQLFETDRISWRAEQLSLAQDDSEPFSY